MACHVHDPTLYLTLVGSADYVEPPRHTSPHSRPPVPDERQTSALTQRMRSQEEEFQQKFALARQHKQQTLQAQQEKEDREFEERYRALMANRDSFMRDLEREVKAAEVQQQKKKEALHKDWTESVFLPIQAEIHSKVESLSPLRYSTSKRRANERYVEVSDRTRVFRDIIDRGTYDPFKGTADSVKYNSRLPDPLLAALGPQFGTEPGSKTPQPARHRDTATPFEYLNPEATPYGRYSEQNPRLYQRKQAAKEGLKPVLPDDYERLPPEEAWARQRREFPIGLRMPSPAAPPATLHPTGRKAVVGPPSKLVSF